MIVMLKIGAIRAKKQISQTQLAKLAGLSRYTIQNMEDQNWDPKLSTLIAISRALEVEITDLYEIVD